MPALFLIILLALIATGKPKLYTNFPDEGRYISRSRTQYLNGIFILLIILLHSCQTSFVEVSILLKTVRLILSLFSKFIVTPFLFFSGYGLYLTISKNKTAYLAHFFRKRFLHVLLCFDSIVLLHLACWLLWDRETDWLRTLLALVGWSHYGNVNWYICIILLFYLITYFSFRLTEGKKAVFLCTLSSVLLICWLYAAGKESIWYRNLLCFPCGMAYALYRKDAEHYLSRLFSLQMNPAAYALTRLGGGIILCLIACGSTLFTCADPRTAQLAPFSTLCWIILRNIASCFFIAGITLIFSAVKWEKPSVFLSWCGSRAILALLLSHFLVIMVLQHAGIHIVSQELYFLLVFLSTLLLGMAIPVAWDVLLRVLKIDK